MTRMKTGDARFNTFSDPLVIRASANLGKLIPWQRMRCIGHDSTIHIEPKPCDRPATAILFSRGHLLTFVICDLCAARCLRADGFLLLAQAPLNQENSA